VQKKSPKTGDIPLNAQQTAEVAWINQTFSTHPTRGLTPDRLNGYLEAAERGNLREMADLGRDIQERDGHIAAELGKRCRAILTQNWQLEPPAKASAQEVKQTEELQEWIASINDLEDVFLDCLDAIGHGFSALEFDWENNQTFTLPKKITHRPQSWFQTPINDGNDIRLIDGSPDGAPLWENGWIVHKHRAKSGWVNSSGLFRTLAWPYLLKAYALGDWAEFLEVYGQPIRVGIYEPGASEPEKKSLLRAVSSMGHNAAGIISSNMKVLFENAVQGQYEAFLAMIKYLESVMSKAILGGTLTSGADGKSSTNALGNIHEEVRQDLMQSDARQLATTLTRYLVQPIYLANFPGADIARCPKFKIVTEQKENITVFAEALPKLVQIGFQIPLEWAQTKLGIPIAKKGDVILQITNNATPPVAERTQKLAWRAVLAAQPGSIAPPAPGQAALESLVNHNLGQDQTQAMLAMLAPAIEAIRLSADPEEAAAALLAAHPEMDDEGIVNALTQAFYIADVLGRIHADTI
jgi:phage gp29-like protein